MVQFPAGTREYSLLQNVQTGFGVHSASYSMGTKGSFPGGYSGYRVKFAAHLLLGPMLRMSAAISLHPFTPYTFMVWKGKTLPCTKKIIKTHQHIYSLILVHFET